MNLLPYYRIAFPCLLSLLLCAGCQRSYQLDRPVLTRLNIIDRDGFATTVQTKERLAPYQATNFLTPQAFEKVMGTYNRDANGQVRSFITSYHPNGQVRQFLEVINARAHGQYRAWHENGNLKLDAVVMGGEGDLTDAAVRTWVFEGQCQAWNESGALEAQFFYEKGQLEGEGVQYYSNGTIRRRQQYHNNLLDGLDEFYDPEGRLLESACYEAGLLQGQTVRYWSPEEKMAHEEFDRDCLLSGEYYDRSGRCISTIESGNGYRIIFDMKHMRSREQYQNGFPEGSVEVFGEEGQLLERYEQKEGKKNGQQIIYYPPTSRQALRLGKLNPKISLMWRNDQLQGIVKTWYEDGQIESQREMSENIRNGIASAWYRDGGLMLMEEYDHDKLVKGEYYRRGDRLPISIIANGSGDATLYDSEGNLIRKTAYFQSHPVQ